MLYRYLGETELNISICGFGAWAIGGWKWVGQDDQDSIAAIHAALDAGVNWIDTAAIYGAGHSERMVAQALKDIPSDKRPFIFTKFGLGTDTNAMRRSASYAEIIKECEESLQRLGVDCIDLYQQHWPVEQPIEEIARACDELRQAGKIRFIGVSNYSVELLDAWQQTGVPLHCLQTRLSPNYLEAAEDVIPWCFEHQVGCIAYSPLHRGMWFGKWSADKQFEADDGRATHPDFLGERFQIHIKYVDKIADVAAAEEIDCAQLIIGVLICNPGLTGCIVGARNAGQGAYIGELGTPMKNAVVKQVEGLLYDMRQELAALDA